MAPLAELEIFHSRQFAPTRRLALGHRRLPVDPAPGPGGVLLGAVVAAANQFVDDDTSAGLHVLTVQVEEGHRIVQPRLRHRFQEDRVGLQSSKFRLFAGETGLETDFADEASPLQTALGAVYAAGELPYTKRRVVFDAIRKGLRWGGAIDRSLLAHLSGLDRGRNWTAEIYQDPVQWALGILDIEVETNGSVHLPDRTLVQRRFRDLLRDAHPDHGGVTDDAAQRISDLTEARKILLSK